jgi:hypothetical protein
MSTVIAVHAWVLGNSGEADYSRTVIAGATADLLVSSGERRPTPTPRGLGGRLRTLDLAGASVRIQIGVRTASTHYRAVAAEAFARPLTRLRLSGVSKAAQPRATPPWATNCQDVAAEALAYLLTRPAS